MSIKAWLFFLDRLALATGIVVALLTGMTGSATPEYSVYEIICVVKITIKYVDECTSIGALTTLKISKSRTDTNSEIAKIK